MIVVALFNRGCPKFFVGRKGRLVPQTSLPDSASQLKKYHTVDEAREDTHRFLGDFAEREYLPYYDDLNKEPPGRLF